jgi:tetratricopeptide (TPR) repeat protein
MVEARYEQGLAHTTLNQLDVAASCFLRVIEGNPGFAKAPFELGRLLQRQYQFESALECYRRTLLIDPSHVDAHANLGAIALMRGQLREAENSVRCAIALDPRHAPAHLTLAIIEGAHGRSAEALAAFERALKLLPNFPEARFNRATLLMRQGLLSEGARDLEARWQLPEALGRSKRRPFRQPQWRGQSLNGKSLLVWGEQGIGDEVRTAALLPDLVARGEHVVVECESRLLSIFERSLPGISFVPRTTPPQAETTARLVGYQIAAEDLVEFLRPSLTDFSGHRPYLHADARRATATAERLAARIAQPKDTRDIRIGISWLSRNTEFFDLKSTALVDWAPIFKTRNASFIDLQYGETDDERVSVERKHGIQLVRLPELDLKQDMEGLAALISNCDLIITVSNITAHLAGALGKETWVILPFGHAQPWYWFSDRSDSPWYPSLKLYRQRKFDDWLYVLRQIAKDLKKWQPKVRH